MSRKCWKPPASSTLTASLEWQQLEWQQLVKKQLCRERLCTSRLNHEKSPADWRGFFDQALLSATRFSSARARRGQA